MFTGQAITSMILFIFVSSSAMSNLRAKTILFTQLYNLSFSIVQSNES